MFGIILAGALAVGGPSIAIGDGWYAQVRQDPINDVILAAAQKNGQGIALKLWCQNNQKEGVHAEITIDDYVGLGDKYYVIYRLDQGKPVGSHWNISSRGRGSTLFPSPYEGKDFVRGVSASAKVAFKISTYDSNSRELIKVLDISGAANAIQTIDRECRSMGAR